MISTLIRSRDNIITPTPIGTSEYLVDTETNRVIYPKTRLEDIIGLEGFEPPNKPGSSDGGLSSPYIHDKIMLKGKNFPAESTTSLCSIIIPDPGIYLVSAHLVFDRYRTTCTGDGYNCMFTLYCDDDNAYNTRCQTALHGYLTETITGLFKIAEQNSSIEARLYVPGALKPGIYLTENTVSRLEYKYIKLSDIDNT